MGCNLIEPDIVKQLRREEKQGLLDQQKIHSNNESNSDLEKFKDIKFILELQNIVIEEFLFKIKQGKIKTNRYVLLSLYELKNYYNSNYWKILSDKISIDKHILSFYHLVNTYIEHLEQSKELNESTFEKVKKLRDLILIINSVK